MTSTLVPLSDEIFQTAASKGAFLPYDYRRAAEDAQILCVPKRSFRFGNCVIVGARSVPLVTVRHAYLAGLCCERVHVKAATEDEAYLLSEMVLKHKDDLCEIVVDSFPHDQEPDRWTSSVDRADYVVVYGGAESISHYRNRLRPDQRFLPYGPKISLSYLDLSQEYQPSEVYHDFYQFYGQGCLSPRALIVNSTQEQFEVLEQELCTEFVKCEETLREFWSKLPMAAQTEASSRFPVEVWDLDECMPDNLYGTVLMTRVESFREFLGLSSWYRDIVNTVASNTSVLGADVQRMMTQGITRVCVTGQMQHTRFMHRHDGRDQLEELTRYLEPS